MFDIVIGLLDTLLGIVEQVPVTAAVGGLLLVMLAPLLSDRRFAILQLSLFLVPLTHYAPAGTSNGIRGITLVLGAIRMLSTHRFGNVQLRNASGQWQRFLLVSTLLVLLSATWSVSPFESLVAGVGLASTVVVLWSISPDGRTARWAAEWLLSAIVTGSLLLMPFSDAWSAGRLRGPMANANGLAAFLLMAAVLSLSSRRFPAQKFVLCSVLLFLTGSRSAAVALSIAVVSLGITQWRRRRVTGRGVALTLATASGLAVVMLTVPFDRLPWRTKDTRSDIWATSFGLVQDHVLLGLGGGAFPIESGSSYLRVVAEVGVVGATVCTLVLLSSFRLRTLTAVQVALFFALAVHMAFEGWFLTGGSAIFLFAVAATVEQPSADLEASSLRSRATGARGRSLARPPSIGLVGQHGRL